MPDPPSGTVTFLFTDIEGTTKRWEQYPQQMQLALQRHDEIVPEGGLFTRCLLKRVLYSPLHAHSPAFLPCLLEGFFS